MIPVVYIKGIRTFIMRHQLVTAITAVVGVALVMTGISMTLYVWSGASGLDLSRPGFTSARNSIDNAAGDTAFDATGPLEESDVAQFRKLLLKQQNKLKDLGSFSDDTLSDVSLGFTVDTSPEPIPGNQ